jgi:hypothetical protein
MKLDENQRKNLSTFTSTTKNLIKKKKVASASNIMGWFDYSMIIYEKSFHDVYYKVEDIRKNLGEFKETVLVIGKYLGSINFNRSFNDIQIVGIILLKFDPEIKENPIQIYYSKLKKNLEKSNLKINVYSTFGFHDFLLWTIGNSMEDIFDFVNDLNKSNKFLKETMTICGKSL